MESVSMRWVRRLLRLYPRAWRTRYQDEVEEVLAEHTVTLWTVLDVLVGAADARLHGELLPGRLTSMAHRIRTSEIAIFCAFVLFVVAWLPVEQVRDPLPDWERVARLHPEIQRVFEVAQAAGAVALLALLAGGLPILCAAFIAALRTRRRNVLVLLLVPIVAVATLAGFAALTLGASTTRQSAAPDAPLTPLAVVLQLSLLLLGVLVVVVSTAAVARAVARSEVSERVLRFALVPAAVVTVAIGVGLLATVALVALSVAYAPQFGPGNLAFCGVAMLLAAGIAATALRRGFAARVA